MGRPQPEQVHVVHPVAEDRGVVGQTVDQQVRHPADAQGAVVVVLLGMAAEPDRKAQLGPRELPGIAIPQPGVAHLDLPAVLDTLVEDTELVADAVADGRDLQRGERVHEAGREPPEAAVAEAGLLLGRHYSLEVELELLARLAGLVHDAEVDQVVDQMRPQQVFGGKVTDRPCIGLLVGSGGVDPAFEQAVAHGVGRGHVEIVQGGHLGEPALEVEEVVDVGLLEGIFRHADAGVLALCPHLGLHDGAHGLPPS